ncbi:MAG: hypothetical protein ABSF35_24495 [Polyangia bacterium]
MRTLGIFLAFEILALTVGCGGNSTASTDGGGGAQQGPVAGAGGGGGTTMAGPIAGTGGAGGGGVAGGGSGAGGIGGSAGSCNYPSCLASLATTCVPSGSCVSQTDTTTFATNTCYSNGVKEIESVNVNTTTGSVTVTLTYEKGNSTCYSVDVAGISAAGSGGPITMTFKNASGSTIGTGTVDSTTNAVTITCTGGQPVILNSSCDTSSYAAASSTTSTCTAGVCTP